MSPFLRRVWNRIQSQKGLILALTLVSAYALAAVKAPQGLQAFFEKQRQIRQLQEENAAMQADIARRQDRIKRLQESPSEQDMEIRKRFHMQKPGETTFMLPDKDGSKDGSKDGTKEAAPSRDAR